MSLKMIAAIKMLGAVSLAAGVILTVVYASEGEAKRVPPALQKRAELPPGWQQKLVIGWPLEEAIFNHGVEIELKNNPPGVITIRVEDRIIRVFKATREVVDIF
jgi:hypothetical protein